MKFKKCTSLICAVTAFCLVFSACRMNKKSVAVSSDTVAMGSVVSITSYTYDEASGRQLNSEIIKQIQALDRLISKNDEAAELYKLNSTSGEAVTVDKELYGYIENTVKLFSKSEGKLSASSGALTELWGIDTDSFRLPTDNEIKNALPLCNDDLLVLDGGNYSVKLADGQKLNLGAVGKGIACDKAAEWLTLSSQASQGLVISVGGSVAVTGSRGDGKPWKIGVRNPFGTQNDYFAKLSIENNGFVSTSGSYEKSFEIDGKGYHHILDLTTGYPVETELVGVTVLAPSGFLSDALSTLCFSLGEEASQKLLSEYSAQAVFVYGDKTVSVTEGLADSLEITDREFTVK